MVGHTTPSIRIKFFQMTTLLNKWLVEESLYYRMQIIDETDEDDSKNERVLPSIPPLPPLRQTLRPIDRSRDRKPGPARIDSTCSLVTFHPKSN